MIVFVLLSFLATVPSVAAVVDASDLPVLSFFAVGGGDSDSEIAPLCDLAATIDDDEDDDPGTTWAASRCCFVSSFSSSDEDEDELDKDIDGDKRWC